MIYYSAIDQLGMQVGGCVGTENLKDIVEFFELMGYTELRIEDEEGKVLYETAQVTT